MVPKASSFFVKGSDVFLGSSMFVIVRSVRKEGKFVLRYLSSAVAEPS